MSNRKQPGSRKNQKAQLVHLLALPKRRLTSWQRRQIKVLSERVKLIGGEGE